MIGQVLFTDPASILIFDEPELHVHRAILGRLWDELEGERPDCAFVLITHDLEFAAARPARTYVLESFSPPASWKVQALPEGTGFSEQLTATILGSRRPILFVEGDGGSMDLATYRACFPKHDHSCLVAEHCWDPVGLAIVQHAYRFKHLSTMQGRA